MKKQKYTVTWDALFERHSHVWARSEAEAKNMALEDVQGVEFAPSETLQRIKDSMRVKHIPMINDFQARQT